MPVLQNVTLATRTAARAFPRAEIDLVACEDCGFVFNRRFRSSALEYAPGYTNTQVHSPAFRAYVDGVVTTIRAKRDLRGCRIVDVGCGDGTFLRTLVGNRSAGNRGVGFDPAYVGPATALGRQVRFHRRLFGAGKERLRADIVLCRQVIEHLEDPLGFLARLHDSLASRPGTTLFFETSCIEWIFRNRAFHDVYYEHCSLFGPRSFAALFRRAGFGVRSVWHAFGGAYLWIEATVGNGVARKATDEPRRIVGLARRFREAERRSIQEWSARLRRHRGRIALWGAGAKGVTFANLLDPGRRYLDCVVDINPAKRGRFLAGSGHSIVAPEDLRGRDLRSVIVANPEYLEEVRKTLAEIGESMEVLSL